MFGPRFRRTSILLALYGAAVVAVPVVFGPTLAQRTDAATGEAVRGDADELEALSGVWWRYEPGAEGDPVRFYYFHGDGKGLYRYGRIGHTNTNSFDYDVEDDALVLRFRKAGERHAVAYRIEREGDRDWLVLEDDPREPGSTRYFRASDRTVSGPAPAHPQPETGPAPAGHMWIDQTQYATGGYGFSFYQLRPAGIDGRGVGWHHRGDFDDWSTESLVYRIVGERIELSFPLTGEHQVTRFDVRERGETRELFLASDPRDFWHPHTYRDIGPSFGSLALPTSSSPLERIITTAALTPPGD